MTIPMLVASIIVGNLCTIFMIRTVEIIIGKEPDNFQMIVVDKDEFTRAFEDKN